jgi:WD40 repeat protein
MLNFKYHEDSCRKVEFSQDGNVLYTVSADCSIGIVSNGILEGRLTNAHPVGISTVLSIENAVIATGDDDGLIKLWDLR